MAQCSRAQLEYIIDHVILPPKLPDKTEDGESVAAAEKALLNLLVSVIDRFRQQCTSDCQKPWLIVRRMVSCWSTTNPSDSLSDELLSRAFSNMEPQDALPIRVRAQNAGLICRRLDDAMSIECFELSPCSGNIMSCNGSLRRLFPAHGVAIPIDVANNPQFRHEFFTMLARMDLEVVDEMVPVSQKAKILWTESRDTCHPGLVTELLMATISALGRPFTVSQIQKRIRDDVVWANSVLPWRRSTLWLMLRVSIQTTLAVRVDAATAATMYKNFMVYFLKRLLSLASGLDLSVDLCKLVQMKLARRVVKLGSAILPFVQDSALAAAETVSKAHSELWQSIQETDTRRHTVLNLSTVENDTVLTLSTSRSALDSALQADEQSAPPSFSIPSDYPEWLTIESTGLPSINSAIESKVEKLYALAEFEQWISQSLPSWVEQTSTRPSKHHCSSLEKSAQCYNDIALDIYHCPEQLSGMLLTIADLWHAMDTIAGSLMPLLHDYKPNISSSVFTSLLLPKKIQMEQLQKLESHINNRQENAKFTASVFSDPEQTATDAFAYQYFDRSSELKELRKEIEADAKSDWEAKEKEWQEGTTKYTELTKQWATLHCNFVVGRRGGESHIKKRCKRCKLKSKIESMTIDVFECPLPRLEVQCRQVLLELRCPVVLATWRNLIWMIIHDLGRLNQTMGAPPFGQLSDFGGLRRYVNTAPSRIVLGASNKARGNSHYTYPVALEDLRSDHRRYYQYFDKNRGIWINHQTEQPSFLPKCQTLLREDAYKHLQYAIDSTTHTQNEVLAAQIECRTEMGLHEYIAYASLRADGEQTQWLNISRELKASNLTWNTESVCSLIQHTAWQAGSLNASHLRTTHSVFAIPEFTVELLSNVENMLHSIQENRQSSHTMNILIIILLRTLSLTANDNCIAKALGLLRHCRSTLFHWIRGLENLLRVTSEAKKMSNVQLSLLRTALLCKSTFDVDLSKVSQVITMSDDVHYWTASSMTIVDNTPNTIDALPMDLQEMLVKDAKLSQMVYRQLERLLTGAGSTGLDRAVVQAWSSFHSTDESWVHHEHPEGRWIYKQTCPQADKERQTVFYNILSGQLLVDGRPLGVLPREYSTDDVFTRIFGPQILRVSVSDMTGMSYMTSTIEYNYRFYFGMRGTELVIRARTPSTVLELIPHRKFLDDFPTILIEDYTHWLDLESSTVEFRPLSRKWNVDNQNWRLIYQPGGISHLQNTESRLVDIRSSTCQNTHQLLGGLEVAAFMHITKPFHSKLHITLPRLGFQFFANDKHEIECLELRKVIDQDQSIGTLVGLKSRLVLCASGDHSKLLDRVVLIPKGAVNTRSDGASPCVTITTSGRDVECLRYRHDATIGRLEGDGTMTSRLYQAYLHALTSYILPDPLTGYLGTEQSLRILKEQVLRCCKPLEPAEMELLESINTLTPSRFFYPVHQRVMQRVEWRDDLSPLCQHSDFARLANNVFTQAQKFQIFYENPTSNPGLKTRGDGSLLQRARIRNSTHLNVDYGGDQRTSEHDQDYAARDAVYDLERAKRAYAISSFVTCWTGDMAVRTSLTATWNLWGDVVGFGTTFDFSQSISDMLTLKLQHVWGSIYEYCRLATRRKCRFKLLFMFSTISYGSQVTSLDHLKILLAFATNADFRNLPPLPTYRSFNLRNGSAPDPETLKSVIGGSKKPFVATSQDLPHADRRRERADYLRASSTDVTTAVKFYRDQWPCREPAQLPSTHVKWLYRNNVHKAMQDRFAEWYKNRECENHLELIQDIIDSRMTSTLDPPYDRLVWHKIKSRAEIRLHCPLPTFVSLMTSRCPDLPALPSIHRDKQHTSVHIYNPALRSLIVGFGSGNENGEMSLRTQYKANLLASVDAFQQHPEVSLPDNIPVSTARKAISSFHKCREHYIRELDSLTDLLAPDEPMYRLVKLAGLWPRLRLCDLLAMIATTSRQCIPKEWQESIFIIGLGTTILQRARRLVIAVEQDDAFNFFREIENPGRTNWSASEMPDWLLTEIDGDFLIRPTQVRVALEMINPSSSSNALMQLNMGEGKSSVITPLIAATLADGKRVVRVIVLRPLARQMEATLIQRLSGLVNRPIYLMPFSRKTEVNETTMASIQTLYNECMTNGGILIAQPEHVLSLKLQGIERIAMLSVSLGTKLMNLQAWLDTKCRDILDESDEILDVKFQLIYTLGAQRAIDGQPDRWLVIQSVLDLIQQNASLLRTSHPEEIELDKRAGGSFPTIRLLSSRIRHLLISKVCDDIGDSKLPGLMILNLPIEVKKAAVALIADQSVSDKDCGTVQQYFNEDEPYIKKLLLLRGLIANGILLHVLHSKRWSVNYGLHLTRCLSAVPYRAKGVPASAAEFGHPDVTIALTCLSYYYTGLENDQLRTCLDLLHKYDDPSVEYGNWTRADDSFPSQLRHWSSVNLEDHQQCEEQLFPVLKFNKKTADFFMGNVVFPREGKEFDHKLSASGWDIPAKLASINVTTGFSGTNDNRFLLPSSIAQRDLPELKHTSGKVLEFLVKPENVVYSCAKDSKGAHLPSLGLLEFITQSDARVRVLIDVGAQILDLTNDQVIVQWLALNPDVAAGVYFDTADYPMVMARSGKVERLASSAFLDRMEQCVVYLDEVHTRGTDLKLPHTCRAAVTLGPRLTKDRLVQACMRLRLLGHGQSFMFVAPPEVHQDILNTIKVKASELTGLHVIEWALEQSCLQIERNQPLRVYQGLSYYRRCDAVERLQRRLPALDVANEDMEKLSQNLMTRNIVEHEPQSLRDMYAPEAMHKKNATDLVTSSRSNPDRDVQDLIGLWDQMDPRMSHGANFHEELEREVGHEVEQEAQIKRPSKATAEKPKVDSRLRDYIRLGTQEAVNVSFIAVYKGVLQLSSLALLLKRRAETWDHLRVSSGFIKTVKQSNLSSTDNYVRPVNWVLVSKDSAVNKVVLISQHEVNQCIEDILDESSRVALVAYEPRVTKSMPSIDSSKFQPLPYAKAAWGQLPNIVRQELHLFSGQLYFTTFKEYQNLAASLITETAPKTAAPVGFIKEWMGIRRKGQNYVPTHVGQLVDGRVLQEEIFEAVKEDLFIDKQEKSGSE
ncbi:MAG: hypothetical protein Q9209_006387 [Squamulea sp. 1 TL-2023]